VSAPGPRSAGRRRTGEAPADVDEAVLRAALAEVPDPELPVVSIVDLGMVEAVDVTEAEVRVELLPTFVGCPAIELIREAVEARIAPLRRPWTSDRISERGRGLLRAAGIAPPLPGHGPGELPLVRLDAPVACPSCGSMRTRLENAFGPTPCRTIRYCVDCRQPFEQLKTV
jgi:ring-1,2-phenylacetyl-CoA epoxidase subunit PaaD